MKLQKINNFRIKPVAVGSGKSKSFKGDDVFKRQYFNIALLSKTASGKTTVIKNLIDKFKTKNTLFLIFASTINLDATWAEILKTLPEDSYVAEPHFIDGKDDLLDQWMRENNNFDETDDSEEPDTPPPPQPMISNPLHMAPNCGFSFSKPPQQSNQLGTKTPGDKTKKTKNNCEWIIIFDDLSSDMRHKSVSTLLKKSRHYRAKVIISSQSLSDITPSAHSQLYALCLFRGISDDTLHSIYKRYEMFLPFEEFAKIYHEITQEPYKFLTLLPVDQEIRKNLDQKIILKDHDNNNANIN